MAPGSPGPLLSMMPSGAQASISGERGINMGATVLWLAGIGLYHALAAWAPAWGSALPTLAATLLLGWLTRPSAALKAA